MIAPVGPLHHEIPAAARGAAGDFDREGYAVGREVFTPQLLRELRTPLIEALVADGHIAPVAGDEDRFLWVGDAATFDRFQYHLPMQEAADELLMRTGVAGSAIERVWGRRPAIWNLPSLFVSVPGAPTHWHRDGWPMTGLADPEDHVNLWCPLTRLGTDDGPLAIAVGSHLMEDLPADGPPRARVLHEELSLNTRIPPSAEQLASLWRTTSFEVGDALLFRPDIVHGAVPNDGPYVRLSMVMRSQDARIPLPLTAGLSLDAVRDLSDVEWLTLALQAVQPISRWDALCAFYPRGVIGRLWTEQPKDRVERAFTTLESRGLIAQHTGSEWPLHEYFHATRQGRLDVTEWLVTPDAADARVLPVKLLLCDWLDLDAAELLEHVGYHSPATLVS